MQEHHQTASGSRLIELLVGFVIDSHLPLSTDEETVAVRPLAEDGPLVHLRLNPFVADESEPISDLLVETLVEGWGAKRSSVESSSARFRAIPRYQTLVEARFECPAHWLKTKFIDGRLVREFAISRGYRYLPLATALEAVRRVGQIIATELERFGFADVSLGDLVGTHAQAILVNGNPHRGIDFAYPEAPSIIQAVAVDEEEGRELRDAIRMAEAGHPKYRSSQWTLRAYRLRNEYRLSEAVVAWHAAIEAFCYHKLELLLVDEGRSATQIRNTIDTLDHIRVVFPELQRRLGGPASEWQWSGDGTVGRLRSELYRRRNEVTHRDEAVSTHDYDAAEGSVKEFVTFVESRLLNPRIAKTYPRSALVHLGIEQLREVVGRETREELERLESTPNFWEPAT